MATERPPTHEHLLTLVNKLRAAAEDKDRGRLQSAAQSFYEGLVEHLGEEAFALRQSPPAEGRLLRRGQQRILDTAVALVRDTELVGMNCSCQRLAERLVAELSLQAQDERRCLAPTGSEAWGRRPSNSESLPWLGSAA